MSSGSSVDVAFAAMREYIAAHESYKARGVVRGLNPHDPEWVGDEPWRIRHYFEVGEDALRWILAALVGAARPTPRTILDFPSGSGRVTRHLQAFFPTAEIWASDIDQGHLNFCSAQLGVRTRLSPPDPADLAFEVEFDLVFCGSLITHLPEHRTRAAISAISAALSPRGIAVVTLQGRHSRYIQRHKWKYVEDEFFRIAEDQYLKTGFGFVEYRGEMRQRFDCYGEYGVALIRPSWVIGCLETDPRIRLLGYFERAWDDHQDVLVFGRPGPDE